MAANISGIVIYLFLHLSDTSLPTRYEVFMSLFIAPILLELLYSACSSATPLLPPLPRHVLLEQSTLIKYEFPLFRPCRGWKSNNALISRILASAKCAI